MPLVQVQISNVRNLRNVNVELAPAANVIYGQNASGKTSFLEAIHILGRGRSFRHRDLKLVIQAGQTELIVAGQVSHVHVTGPSLRQLGVKRSLDGGFEARQDGRVVASASELASELPLQLIGAQSFALLEGGALQRRQFIDWGVFHVEHSYSALCRRFQRALKQRNQLLRHDRMDEDQLSTWTLEFARLSEEIARYRGMYLDDLQVEAAQIAQKFGGLGFLDFEYDRGWHAEEDLRAVLEGSLGRDKKFGQTHRGAHRADLLLRVDGELAAERLSRGQLKLLIYALKLAQASLHRDKTGASCLFLLDDLPAELDHQHQLQVTDCLNSLYCQYFVTGVDKRDFYGLTADAEHKMFHVERGVVTEDA